MASGPIEIVVDMQQGMFFQTTFLGASRNSDPGHGLQGCLYISGYKSSGMQTLKPLLQSVSGCNLRLFFSECRHRMSQWPLSSMCPGCEPVIEWSRDMTALGSSFHTGPVQLA